MLRFCCLCVGIIAGRNILPYPINYLRLWLKLFIITYVTIHNVTPINRRATAMEYTVTIKIPADEKDEKAALRSLIEVMGLTSLEIGKGLKWPGSETVIRSSVSRALNKPGYMRQFGEIKAWVESQAKRRKLVQLVEETV